ncbi:MAG: helix-turn-helix transcriptional regulator [Acidaminococcaceae bacterium]|nr:helix-turn-helix transcriptional regulator [Acidaminococcaceae bacterium]
MYAEINFTEIGITIKMFRAARHITQMEMAKRIGISQTHLSNIESGRVKINLRLLIKMANIFECKLDDFLFSLIFSLKINLSLLTLKMIGQ